MNKHIQTWLYQTYYSLSRRHKKRLLLSLDIVLCIISIYLSLCLRFNDITLDLQLSHYSWLIFLLIALKISIFYARGIYQPILRYTDIEFLLTVAKAVLYSSAILVILAYLQGFWPLPRSVLIIDALVTLVLVIGMRLTVRAFLNTLIAHVRGQKQGERFVIYGAGMAGCQIAKVLLADHNYQLVAFIDDNYELHHQTIQGLKVYPYSYLPKLLKEKPFDTVLLAMPSLDPESKSRIIQQLQSLPVMVKTIPSLSEIITRKSVITDIRHIDVSELLGRQEVMPNQELLSINVTHKVVMVTGSGGSIGAELCRQIAQLEPKCLILLELNEYSLYSIDLELSETYPHLNKVAYLGNVTQKNYLEKIIAQHRVETIYHAAAYKHVPLVEANPGPGVYNNVAGTLVVAEMAIAHQVSNFVLISTDKAVRPTNVMGASKRVAELVIQALADLPGISTCFAIVRFGNVLDSSGSVVPRFRQQIAARKPITVTHPQITRYFMSIPEAVRLVMQAGAMARGGEIFLLDMGKPIRIYDLALQMIRLSGLIPEQDIPIQFTGLRPGEKLYEELLIDGSNIVPTLHSKIYSAKEHKISWDIFRPQLELLLLKAQLNDSQAVVKQLQKIVKEYHPQVHHTSHNSAKALRNLTEVNGCN